MEAMASDQFLNEDGVPDVRLLRVSVQWLALAEWVECNLDTPESTIRAMRQMIARAASKPTVLSATVHLCNIGMRLFVITCTIESRGV